METCYELIESLHRSVIPQNAAVNQNILQHLNHVMTPEAGFPLNHNTEDYIRIQEYMREEDIDRIKVVMDHQNGIFTFESFIHLYARKY